LRRKRASRAKCITLRELRRRLLHTRWPPKGARARALRRAGVDGARAEHRPVVVRRGNPGNSIPAALRRARQRCILKRARRAYTVGQPSLARSAQRSAAARRATRLRPARAGAACPGHQARAYECGAQRARSQRVEGAVRPRQGEGRGDEAGRGQAASGRGWRWSRG
jgi:hypothetical protein